MQIIGKGRIGCALHSLDDKIKLIGRNEYDQLISNDICMIATRNDDLEVILSNINLPSENLLFVQNGMLSPFLESKGLQNSNRGMLYFAVSKKGDKPEVGDKSIFSGPKANEIVHHLNSIGIDSKAVTRSEFLKVEMEKLIWICTFSLLSQVYDLSVGELIATKKDETISLINEFIEVSKNKGIDLGEQEINSMFEYSASIPNYKGSVKEFKWRNGWFKSVAPELKLHTKYLDQI